MLCYSK